jgi:hypothetical protein
MKDSIDAFATAFEKANRVAKAFGDSADSLLPISSSETLLQYRGRLANKYKKYSKFKDADLTTLGCPIRNDRRRKRNFCGCNVGGELRRLGSGRPTSAIVKNDGAGRPITHYIASDPGACWNQFAPPVRHVTRFMTPGR